VDDIIKQAAKVLSEMSVAKMPEGVKRKRDPEYSGVHHIHVDGEHVATIAGWKDHSRGAPSHAKIYHIHNPGQVHLTIRNPKTGSDTSHAHSDHTHEVIRTNQDDPKDPGHKFTVPNSHRSMDDAIDAVVQTHRNNKEFGKGHDIKKRWELASSSVHSVKDHQTKSSDYAHAIHAVKALGHQDLAEKLSEHHDAHKAAAAGGSLTKERIHQLTHDARKYTSTKWNYDTRTNEPKHPDHYHAASAALESRGSVYL
jgi:hypothetical protein